MCRIARNDSTGSFTDHSDKAVGISGPSTVVIIGSGWMAIMPMRGQADTKALQPLSNSGCVLKYWVPPLASTSNKR